MFTSTGGHLAQAEDGMLAGGSIAQDIEWFPMKEWHQGQFVGVGSGTVTFADVASSTAGAGYVELRYAVQYGSATLRVVANGGTPIQLLLAATPNVPSYVPSEWRRVRIAVPYQSGLNQIVLSRVSGGQLALDDVLFSTPEDAALASAHVRGLEPDDMEDLVAFVASLDETDAAVDPLAAGLRVTGLKLKLGSGRRPDRGGFSLQVEIDTPWTAEELSLALSMGMSVRVADADASFDASVSLDTCSLRSSGRAIRCISTLTGARAMLRQTSLGWRIQLSARRLADTSTGADNAIANPVQAPATVGTQWGDVMHSGQATGCVSQGAGALTCR